MGQKTSKQQVESHCRYRMSSEDRAKGIEVIATLEALVVICEVVRVWSSGRSSLTNRVVLGKIKVKSRLVEVSSTTDQLGSRILKKSEFHWKNGKWIEGSCLPPKE
jgi:hypothetical protein